MDIYSRLLYDLAEFLDNIQQYTGSIMLFSLKLGVLAFSIYVLLPVH